MKNTKTNLWRLVLFVCVLVLNSTSFLQKAYGMAEARKGPVEKVHPQPGWPKGLVEMLQHPSRVYSFWVNGNETIYYQATPEQIAELVALFSKTRMRDHVVEIKDQAPARTSFKAEEISFNVSFQIVDGIALWHARQQLAEGKDIGLPLSPRLTIYRKSDPTLLKSHQWPEHLVVHDETSTVYNIGKKKLPERHIYWGGFVFKDGSPPSDFVSSMRARLYLWERDEEEPLELASVDNKGRFSVLFSEEEMTLLRSGVSYVALTIGNYLTHPTAEDFRFPLERLSRSMDEIKPVPISSPDYYWGRLLFEDDTPPVLDPSPWLGASISVSFPFAGATEPDKQGYFRVLFTDEQMEEMQSRAPRKNVYIPSYSKTHHSTALHIFPAELLNKEKKQAGVLRIKKPMPAP